MPELNLKPETQRKPDAPSGEHIRQQLDRITGSPDVKISEKRCAFLRFIVEETLAGRPHKIKGYSVAVAVFGRDETFDPQSDPVVRLEARRLRRDLDTYYAGPGIHDPVRISIPKGGYVPRFEWAESELQRQQQVQAELSLASQQALTAELLPSPDRNHDRPGFAFLLACAAGLTLLLLLLLVTWRWFTNPGESPAAAVRGEPIVMVKPFTIRNGDEDSAHLAAGINQKLIEDLMHFPGFRVFAPSPLSGTAEEVVLARANEAHTEVYAISGEVHEQDDRLQVATQLQLLDSGEVLWVERYDLPVTPSSLIQIQDELSGTIAAEIGQPYGLVSNDLDRRGPVHNVAEMQSYVCVMRAYHYRRSFLQEEYAPLQACLQSAVSNDPDYSDAWAMLGWLYLDAGRYGFSGADRMQDDYDSAYQAALRAVTLEPLNTLALKALSSVQHYRGNFIDSETLMRRAVAINPHDPDALAQLGWRLAVRGNFAEGIPLLERAISRSASPPGWYFHLIAIDQYFAEDFGAMLETARLSVMDGSTTSQALLALASTAGRDHASVRAALEAIPPNHLLNTDSEAFFRRHGATREIADRLARGLDEARAFAAAH